MKRIAIMTVILALALSVFAVQPAQAHDNGKINLDRVREVTERYHRVSAAQAAGYDLVPGLDYCFDNPGVGGMGYHYINVALLDNTIDPLKPEAMVYAPGKNGKLELGAVEYIVPIAAWDAAYSQPPQLFGQVFQRDVPLGVYTLHAWIWKHNPSGVFSEWNPKVSCP